MKPSYLPKPLYWLFVLVIFLGSFALRMVDIDDLPLDFHPTRQLFSALKVRGMYYENVPDIPEWQREMAVQQWKTQPTLEPEFIEYMTLIAYVQKGDADLALPRQITAIFWVVSGFFLFLAARRLVSPDGALLTASFYLFLPYTVYASRSFQPDPLMVAFIAAFIWALAGWLDERKWRWVILTGFFGGLAILMKVVAIFFIAGAALVAILQKMSLKKAFNNAQVWGIATLALLPTLAYYINGMALGGSTSGGSDGRFFPELLTSPSFYLRWGLNLDQVIGYLAIALALLGLLLFPKQKKGILIGLWGGYILYGLIFNYHFSTHDYYQMPFLPVAALSLAPLGEMMSGTLRSRLSKGVIPRFIFVSAWILALLGAAWTVRSELRATDYRPLAESYREAGDLLRDQGKTVALSEDYGYRMNYWGWLNVTPWPSAGDLWYQEKRGDPQNFAQSFNKHAKDRSFFLVTDFEEWEVQEELRNYLTQNYPLFAEGNNYLIFDLR
ncbi:MAG: phospholipid carrier-dependent glycosyltransferase [Anaerolineae bacterium]|nr:phospholipid carrier-dependent glycosyltransferase [Anaerolineae bacterium]MBT7190383.1 phospholipid carrier-dependent glycosyltransferase [Anaerolineae bacterium]MBT7989179.1 phospholipid carrier-dependent glycosyltransferase [Anaerolineae bacterium]